jgi:hypothetical protein
VEDEDPLESILGDWPLKLSPEAEALHQAWLKRPDRTVKEPREPKPRPLEPHKFKSNRRRETRDDQ